MSEQKDLVEPMLAILREIGKAKSTQYIVSTFIARYMGYILLPLSLLCNVFAMYATMVNDSKLTSYSTHILSLSCVDFMYILLYFVLTLSPSNDIGCFFQGKVATFLSIYSVWIRVSLSVSQCIATLFPFQAKTLLTVKRVLTIMAVLCIVILIPILSFPSTVTAKQVESRVNNIETLCEEGELYTEYWLFVISINAVVPLPILIITNVVMVYKVVHTSAILQNSNRANFQKRVIKSVLTLSTVFVLLILPHTVFNMIFYSDGSGNILDQFFLDNVNYFLMVSVFNLLKNLTHCINTFTFIVVGGQCRNILYYNKCK